MSHLSKKCFSDIRNNNNDHLLKILRINVDFFQHEHIPQKTVHRSLIRIVGSKIFSASYAGEKDLSNDTNLGHSG